MQSLIDSSCYLTDLEDSDDDISEIQQEIAHLAQCDSEYVTKYYGSFVKGYKLWIGEFVSSLHHVSRDSMSLLISDGVSRWWLMFGPCKAHHDFLALILTMSITAQTGAILRGTHRHLSP